MSTFSFKLKTRFVTWHKQILMEVSRLTKISRKLRKYNSLSSVYETSNAVMSTDVARRDGIGFMLFGNPTHITPFIAIRHDNITFNHGLCMDVSKTSEMASSTWPASYPLEMTHQQDFSSVLNHGTPHVLIYRILSKSRVYPNLSPERKWTWIQHTLRRRNNDVGQMEIQWQLLGWKWWHYCLKQKKKELLTIKIYLLYLYAG